MGNTRKTALKAVFFVYVIEDSQRINLQVQCHDVREVPERRDRNVVHLSSVANHNILLSRFEHRLVVESPNSFVHTTILDALGQVSSKISFKEEDII